MIYFFVFVLSYLLLAYADFRELNGYGYKGYICFSGMLLVLLAACRADSVGTDNLHYQIPLYYRALGSNNPLQFATSVYGKEPLYLLCTYIGAHLGSMFWVHFINAGIFVTFLYLTIWDMRNDADPALALITFLFLYYGELLNAVRQYMAVAIGMYALVSLAKGKYSRAAVLVIAATGFHFSAVILLLVFFCFGLSKLRNKKSILAGMIGSVFLFSLFYRYMIDFGINILHILSSKYMYIVNQRSTGNIRIAALLIILLGWIVLFVYKDQKEKLLNDDFYLYCGIVSIGLILIGVYNYDVYRASLYFSCFYIFLLPKFFRMIKRDAGNMLLSRSGYIALLGVYFFVIYALRDKGGIFPYQPFWYEVF